MKKNGSPWCAGRVWKCEVLFWCSIPRLYGIIVLHFDRTIPFLTGNGIHDAAAAAVTVADCGVALLNGFGHTACSSGKMSEFFGGTPTKCVLSALLNHFKRFCKSSIFCAYVREQNCSCVMYCWHLELAIQHSRESSYMSHVCCGVLHRFVACVHSVCKQGNVVLPYW